MRREVVVWAVVTFVLVVTGAFILRSGGGHANPSSAATGPTSEQQQALTAGVSVRGRLLVRDGTTFFMKGFNSIALVQPDGCSQPSPQPSNAQRTYGGDMLQAMLDIWGANTVRFQVSQKGLDPADPELGAGQPEYLDRIKAGVALARAKGLVVIVSMQDQKYACGLTRPLPSSQTLRAWQALAPAFKDDPDVVFELFNEPVSDDSGDGWRQWRDGGDAPVTNVGSDGSVDDVIGHQRLLDAIRALGATNVVLADGANKGGRLQNLWSGPDRNYLLRDTVQPSRVGYAIHPYFFHIGDGASLPEDRANWHQRFGYLRDTAVIPARDQFPIVVTEWNASVECRGGQEDRTGEFLAYLGRDGIGVLGHAIDAPGPLIATVPGWRPTSFSAPGGPCSPGWGAGEALQAFFRQN